MEKHLDDQTLEALAQGRDDLVSDLDREHASTCEACAEAIAEACVLREQVHDVLSDFAPSAFEVRALVRDALKQADHEKVMTASAQSLVLWSAASLCACFLILLNSGFRSLATVTHVLNQSATVTRALWSVAEVLPASASVLALSLTLVGLLLVIPLRALVSSSAASLLLSFAFVTSPAAALDLEGDWPDPLPRVSVSVDKVLASEALKAAAKAAGVGSVVTLERDPIVSLNVRDVPLPDVIEAVVGNEDVAAKWTGSLLIVHMREGFAPAPAEPPAKAAPLAKPSPAPKDLQALRSVGRVIMFGQSAEVPADARADEAVAFGGDLLVDGFVDRDAVAIGGDVLVRGKVLGDVVAIGGDVDVAPKAEIAGDTLSIGGQVNVAPGAKVEHQKLTKKVGSPSDPWGQLTLTAESHEESLGEQVSTYALRYLTVFLFGLLLLAFAPERFQSVKLALRERPGRSFLVGLLGAFALPILLTVLCITIIGIPVAILLALSMWALMYVALGGAASVLGAALPMETIRKNPIAQLALGSLVLFALSFIPVLGTLCMVIAILMGFGAIVLMSRSVKSRLP